MIVLLETLHPDAEAALRAVDDVVLADTSTTFPDVDRAAVVAVLTRGLGRVDRQLFESLPSVRVVARCGAGLDNIDLAAAEERGVDVVHAPGVTTTAVAEHAIMLMLALARRVHQLSAATATDEWAIRDGYVGTELAGRRLGVLGLGRIGKRVAQLAAAFEMDVVAWSGRGDAAVPTLPLDQVLATSDVVQICTALTPETRGLLDAERLATMRPGSLLVNTARGPIVDHTALENALDAGCPAGYAADVWDPEPPRAEPLLTRADVLVTPHVAALTDTTYRRLCLGPATAVAAIVRGDTPDPSFLYGSS